MNPGAAEWTPNRKQRLQTDTTAYGSTRVRPGHAPHDEVLQNTGAEINAISAYSTRPASSLISPIKFRHMPPPETLSTTRPVTFPVMQRLSCDIPTKPHFIPTDGQHHTGIPNSYARAYLKDKSSSPSDTFDINCTTEIMSEDDSQSVGSGVSDHFPHLHPDLIDSDAPIFEQAPHTHNFKRLYMAQHVEIIEAYPGALQTIGTLNPDYYRMPWGTRVIAIKTDYPSNIMYSVQHGVWTTLEKVSERIMDVWDSRQNEKEKVLFLFAVNRTSQFCGLAEMSGPWAPEKNIDGWKGSAEGAGCVGSIPLTWVFVKNVPYFKFQHIKQQHNKHTPANMWNGMRFDNDSGRQVVEIYASSPHLTNMMAWPADQRLYQQTCAANYETKQRFGYRQVENVRALRGGRGFLRGSDGIYARVSHGKQERNPSAISLDNWRAHSDQSRREGRVFGETHDDEPSPRPLYQAGRDYEARILPSNLDGCAESAVGPCSTDIARDVMEANRYYTSTNSNSTNLNGFLAHMSPGKHFQGDPEAMGDVGGMRVRGHFPDNTLDPNHGRGSTGGNDGAPAANRGLFSPVMHISGHQMHNKAAGNSSFHHAGSSGAFVPPMPDTPGGDRMPRHNTASATRNSPYGRIPYVAESGNFENFSSGKKSRTFMHLSQAAQETIKTGPIKYEAESMKAMNDMSAFNIAKDEQSFVDYPQLFKPANPGAVISPRPYGPPHISHDRQAPVHPLSSRAATFEKMKSWTQHRPATKGFDYPNTSDSLSIPLDKRATYYHLMASKADLEKAVRSMNIEVDKGDYYRVLAQKAEIEKRIMRLSMDNQPQSDSSLCAASHRSLGESENSCMALQFEDRYARSSTSAADSRSNSPTFARKPGRFFNSTQDASSEQSFSSSVKHNVDGIVNSPPVSVRGHKGSSRPEDSKRASTVWPRTIPFADDSESIKGFHLASL